MFFSNRIPWVLLKRYQTGHPVSLGVMKAIHGVVLFCCWFLGFFSVCVCVCVLFVYLFVFGFGFGFL